MQNTISTYRYEIEPRAAELGGGWQLRLWEQEPDGREVEMGGGVFEDSDQAQATAEEWMQSR